MPDAPIRVSFERDSPGARYALDVLLRLVGVRWQLVSAGAPAELVYGVPRPDARCAISAGAEDGWDEPRPLLTWDGQLPILHRPGGGTSAGSVPTVLGFDALYAVYACLTAPWEAIDPADEVGCPIAAEGWLAANGLLERPLVHEYAAALERVLGAAGIATSRAAPSIVLTHDVDSNFGHLFEIRESLALFRRELRERRPSAARRAAGLVRRVARRRGSDPNDRFEDWQQLAAAHGGRPTFFAASFGLFDPGSRRYDVPYDVRHPEVASTLRRLADEGAEIGVHLSLQARRSREQVECERERLEAVAGTAVRSARHHWWALGVPPERMLDWHARAGIVVDCSLGFNDRPGFRRGIAAPFRPFDRGSAGPLPIWELPTCVMDLAVFDGRMTAEEGVAKLSGLLETIVGIGGSLVLDWHAHALNPRTLNGAGPGLLAFLETEAARAVRFRTPLELVDELEALAY